MMKLNIISNIWDDSLANSIIVEVPQDAKIADLMLLQQKN